MTALPSNLTGIINMFINLGEKLIPLLGAIAFLAFVLGVARFVKSTGSEKELKDSKNLLIWGIIGIFVLVTVWGIIYFLQKEFGMNRESKVIVPQINIK